MNFKKIAEIMNLRFISNCCYGDYKNYFFGIMLNHSRTTCQGKRINNILTTIRIPLAQNNVSPESKNNVCSEISANKAAKAVAFVNNELVIDVYSTIGRIKESQIIELCDIAVNALAANLMVTGCAKCSDENASHTLLINGEPVHMCSECESKIFRKVNTEGEEYSQVPNRFGLGTLGAILGSLIGVVVWILIGRLGYVASFGGLAIAYFAFGGYKIFKGKIVKTAGYIILSITVVMMFIAIYLSYAVEILAFLRSEYSYYFISFWELSTKMLPAMIMEDSEVMAELLKNVALGALFTALGSYSVIKNIFTLKPVDEIKKLD